MLPARAAAHRANSAAFVPHFARPSLTPPRDGMGAYIQPGPGRFTIRA